MNSLTMRPFLGWQCFCSVCVGNMEYWLTPVKLFSQSSKFTTLTEQELIKNTCKINNPEQLLARIVPASWYKILLWHFLEHEHAIFVMMPSVADLKQKTQAANIFKGSLFTLSSKAPFYRFSIPLKFGHTIFLLP